MGYEQELKKVIAEVLNGSLVKATILVGSLKLDLVQTTNKIPLNILVTLSQLVSNPKNRDKVSNNDIIKLIRLCCSNISSPTESEINNYFRSLYHLIKYLCEKVSLKDLTNLCDFIFPDWIVFKKKTDDIYELLMHFNILINNNIIIPNLSTKDESSLINCFKQHFHLHQLIFDKKPNLLFQKIRTYVNLFHKKLNYVNFSEFCSYTFQLLSALKPIDDLEVSNEAFNALSSIILLCFDKNCNASRRFIKITFDIMNNLCSNNPEITSCIEIFQLFYDTCARDLELFKESDYKNFKMLREKCEALWQKYSASYLVLKTFYYMSEIVRILAKYFDKVKKELWINMTTDIQVEYMKLLFIIGKIIRNDKYSDKCNENCTVKYNLLHTISVLSLSATFLNLSLKFNSKDIELLHDTALCSIQECCKYINQLKKEGCNRWISNWRVLGSLLYNIASKFYRNENYKLARCHIRLFCAQIISLEGIKNTNLIVENALGTGLQLIANCYMYEQQYRFSLSFLAFGILLCPEMHEKFWFTWMNVKNKANINNIGNVCELTIKDIFERDIEIFKQYYPAYVHDANEVEKLLFTELKSYYNLWASKIPMNNAYKQLLDVCDDIYIRTVATSLCWEKIINLQDETFAENIEKTILLINKKDKAQSLISQLCLSVLYFINYQVKYNDILKKNLSEMNEAVKIEKPQLKPYEEPLNPNDKCDINPTYYNNKIENNIQLHKILNKSVDLWTKMFQNENIKEIKDQIIELNIDNLIKKTAFEYRIQNYRYQMVKVWFLYLQFGKIMEQNEKIFTSIGFILESIDCNSEMAKNLENKGDFYLQDNFTEETITTYYINKSMGYLQSNRLKEGLEHLNNAQKIYDLIKTDSAKILEARILYLRGLYLLKSCEMKLLPHDTNYIVEVHRAFATTAEFYKSNGSKCLFSLSCLFDISLMLGKMYKSLKMPREVRCYTTESVLLAQQLVLPIRTVQYFSLLAFTDLLGHHFEDCRVKISGIDYILGQNNSNSQRNIIEPIEEKIVEVSKEFERINISRNDGIETMLDVPVDHRMRNMQGSPILENKSFTLPMFIYHLDCNCFYCSNLDYSRLILESAHLEALFYLRQSNINNSSKFFKGALKTYKGILKKYESKNLSSEIAALLKKDLTFTYCKMLLDYSLYFVKKQDIDQAIKILHEIIEILGDDINFNPYFYIEVLYNKMNYLTAKEDLTEPEISSNDSSTDYNVYLIKTPENKISTAKIEFSVSPNYEPVIKRRVKKDLKFDLDSDEEKPQEAKTKVYKMKTPIKTPAPKSSKIKIYTPSISGRPAKIQPLNMSLSPRSDTSSDIPIIPITPSDPKSKLQTKKILEKNTKLLTEKLKAERKGVLKESNSNKKVSEEKAASTQKENVRKVRKNSADISEKSAVKEKVNTRSRATTARAQNVTKKRK